jgi:hypothetical protein
MLRTRHILLRAKLSLYAASLARQRLLWRAAVLRDNFPSTGDIEHYSAIKLSISLSYAIFRPPGTASMNLSTTY